MVRHRRAVLQVPETCHWNRYVSLAGQHLGARGVEVLRPGLCLDEPDPPGPPADARVEPRPDVVHVHWPEMLAARYGVDRALAILRDLVARGAHVVQTVHDLRPHEPGADLTAYLREVDALTAGVHFFSAEHERQARLHRPELPARRALLPHPAFPASGRPARRAPGGEVVLGCLGRIRPYKRIAEFAAAFARTAPAGYRLVVAGEPHTVELDRELRRLAASCPAITYRPGFLDDESFTDLVHGVDWVALPYRHVYSSGVLVAAVQAGRPVLCPRPTDALSFGPNVVEVEPWDDVTAIGHWLTVAHRAPHPPKRPPTWNAAAARLISFYDEVIRAGGRPREALQQTGTALSTEVRYGPPGGSPLRKELAGE
ncbi:hypothetical protein AB0I60_01235 [Actinosynnema sp. NPDC050436]|uniref:glycosyltransferase n=1 Tax=Actinosynnema sp. NPDC050436 TaxID=3155659 RepID=UPI0033E6A878